MGQLHFPEELLKEPVMSMMFDPQVEPFGCGLCVSRLCIQE